jgi:hypothetical protein
MFVQSPESKVPQRINNWVSSVKRCNGMHKNKRNGSRNNSNLNWAKAK